MSDREFYKQKRESYKKWRSSLVACWQCGTKEHPCMRKCRCGLPNENFDPKQEVKL